VSDTGHKSTDALFHAVQLLRLFADSKTFPDCVPIVAPELIQERFRALLEDFVRTHFVMSSDLESPAPAAATSLSSHIDTLWSVLARQPSGVETGSLIPLPHPYVVPGGRFREIYYWDSYFTMEGLVASDRLDLVESMIQNFAWLIDTYGHVPNGNRRYFISRSQPPVFCLMLELFERKAGFDAITRWLPQLETEYRYWMDRGLRGFAGRPLAHRRTVMPREDVVLNRYWDERNTPREESYAEDVELFHLAAPEYQHALYRNLRAGAESGWDFSSRWCREGEGLESIRTTELLPVDLNSLLYRVEVCLADWLGRVGDTRAAEYATAAERRKAALMEYCWDEDNGWFFDYSWTEGARTGCWSLAGAFPLYCGLLDDAHAARVAHVIETHFLRPGGVVTTLTESPQQWDCPNGWAPLQWIVVQGLLRHGHAVLAREIAARFVSLADRVYQRTGKLMEKYDVCDMSRFAGGGEYPVQDGFGWTNGVVRAFISEFGEQARSEPERPSDPAADALLAVIQDAVASATEQS
jgi:alpha,alpha-trehalase